MYDRQLGEFVYCNQASETLFGISPAELLAKNDFFLNEQFIYKTDLPIFEIARKKFGQFVTNGDIDSAPVEFRINHPSGNIRWILQRNFPKMAQNKEVPRLFMVFSDITERKNLEQELQRYALHLEEVVTERMHKLRDTYQEFEAFTYSISHDLRSPLRHIHGFSRILEDDYGANLPPKALDYLQRIQQNAAQMSQLIDELLKLFGIGRREIVCSQTNLNRMVQNIIEELRPEYQNRDIEWSIMPLPMIYCDKMLVKQALVNILSNAIKFTKNRSKTKIKIGVRNQSTIPQFFISDNGVGFDMKYSRKLFIPFQRLHRSDEFEGTGIGLALTQRIIKRHRGRIWAESEPNVGTKIWFTLNEYE